MANQYFFVEGTYNKVSIFDYPLKEMRDAFPLLSVTNGIFRVISVDVNVLKIL